MEERVRPIRPEEVGNKKEEDFPSAVFAAFNELILRKDSSVSITVKQDDVVALMVEKGLKKNEIYEKGWLNVEDVYREAGWQVSYDKPAYNENYPATFTFEPRSKKK